MAEQKTKQSVVDLVVNHIVQSIIDGILKPGDRLPTEQALCELLDVGRNSVREAVKQLEAFGVLYIRRADGTFIADRYEQKMLEPILYSIILREHCWSDFVQLRKVIDIGTLHVLMTQGDRSELISQLESTLIDMDVLLSDEAPDAQALMICDTQFHDLLTQAVNNPQLGSISDYITRLTIPSRQDTLSRLIAQDKGDVLLTLHRQIIDLLDERQIDKIDTIMTAHYQYWMM